MPPTRFWQARSRASGSRKILESIVEYIPPPSGKPDAPLRALVFDSKFDQYMGVVSYVRVVDGAIKAGQKIRFMATGKEFEVIEVGTFAPQRRVGQSIGTGEVGYVAGEHQDDWRRDRRRYDHPMQRTRRRWR